MKIPVKCPTCHKLAHHYWLNWGEVTSCNNCFYVNVVHDYLRQP
jgi:DNA-directed RNA polymerase subunit N (RpoN/RPB10)